MIYIGYFLFSISIGFFIGASNSPVIAAYFAILVGLIGAFFGSLKLLDDKTERSVQASYVGKLLSIFAIGLISGELIGESHRNNLFFTDYNTLVWEGLDKPKTTHEALDWIMVKNKMESLGYKDNDILKVYSIRLDEIKRIETLREAELANGLTKHEMTSLYDKDSPFNKALNLPKISSAKKGGRGPASVDN